MVEYGIHAFSAEDTHFVVARLNQKRDGRITFKEFKTGFTPVLSCTL